MRLHVAVDLSLLLDGNNNPYGAFVDKPWCHRVNSSYPDLVQAKTVFSGFSWDNSYYTQID